jgi:hypothetical protein
LPAIWCEKNHIWRRIVFVFAETRRAQPAPSSSSGGCDHQREFSRNSGIGVTCANCLGVRSVRFACHIRFREGRHRNAGAETGLHPDVYRLCAGEIPNVRAITFCLRRQKANLSDACRAVFEQGAAVPAVSDWEPRRAAVSALPSPN